MLLNKFTEQILNEKLFFEQLSLEAPRDRTFPKQELEVVDKCYLSICLFLPNGKKSSKDF